MARTKYESHILRHLFHHPELTRSEIAQQLGARKNTVGSACEMLLRSGVVREQENNSKRNSRLSLDPSAFYSLGVEHLVDSLVIVLMDANRTVVSRFTSALAEMTPADRVHAIIGEIRNALPVPPLRKENVVGIGFSDFIPHNIGTGLKTKSVWMPGWGDINIKALIEEGLGLPVAIMRCTDAFSIAEHAFGSCQGVDSFCVVQLDQGIGLAVFKNGTYLTGSTDIFGEMGHTIYREDGEICKCGNRGCLETFAGVGAIVQKVNENSNGQETISLDDIILKAVEGNKLTLLVLTEAARAIGDTIANMVNLLGITRIVLYGELAKAGELLRQHVVSSIRKHCIYPLNQDTEVNISALDRFGSATGAAYAELAAHFEPGDQ